MSVPASVRHPKSLFPDSEPRYVYANDRRLGPDKPLVFLPDGEAATFKQACHEGHLWCPYPGCNSRFATARGGSRRHCFVHVRHGNASAHGPESYFHVLGKELVKQWALRHYPGARVQKEAQVECGRRADVLVTLEDGSRFAFEVQYAALSPVEALQRHHGYRAVGIHDVWLLGHRPPHLVPARAPPHLAFGQEQEEALRLAHMGETQRALVRAGAQAFWLAPEAMQDGAVITAWTATRRDVDPDTLDIRDEPLELPIRSDRLGHLAWRHLPHANIRLQQFETDALDTCRLEGGQFITPTLRTLWEEKGKVDAATQAALEAARRNLPARRAAEARRLQAQRADEEKRRAATQRLENALRTNAARVASEAEAKARQVAAEEAARRAQEVFRANRGRPQLALFSEEDRDHALGLTLLALQRHPWFVVKTHLVDQQLGGTNRTTYSIRNSLYTGLREVKERAFESLEAAIAWCNQEGHEVVVLEQEVRTDRGTPFSYSRPVPLNWSLEGESTKRQW